MLPNIKRFILQIMKNYSKIMKQIMTINKQDYLCNFAQNSINKLISFLK